MTRARRVAGRIRFMKASSTPDPRARILRLGSEMERTMNLLRAATIRIAAVGTVTLFPLDVDAQEQGGSTEAKRKDSVTKAVAGQHYSVDGWKRAMLGAGWRDVWVTPISVPSLNLDTYAGGLKVLERGGGYQSITLHLQE